MSTKYDVDYFIEKFESRSDGTPILKDHTEAEFIAISRLLGDGHMVLIEGNEDILAALREIKERERQNES